MAKRLGYIYCARLAAFARLLRITSVITAAMAVSAAAMAAQSCHAACMAGTMANCAESDGSPDAALGGIGTGRDAGDAAGDAVGGRLFVVERAVYETLQRVQLSLQLVESAGGKAQRDVGHHLADDAADVRLRPGGDDLALDGEVPDGRTAFHAAEKAVLRAALRQAQAGDLGSLSVEVSEEDRDRDGGAVRVNVVREHDGQSLE